MEGSFPVYTPIEKYLYLEKACENSNVKVPYRELIGSLLYLAMASRPDICYAVNYFSKFQTCFSEDHFLKLRRVLCYLISSSHLKLKFCKPVLMNSDILECFVDADWANDPDRKSVSGYFVTLFGNPILWATKNNSVLLYLPQKPST